MYRLVIHYHPVYLSLERQRQNLLTEQRKVSLLQYQSTLLSVIPLMLMVLEITNTKQSSDAEMVAYADGFSAADSMSSLKDW